jgi:hypothetical protein
MGMLMKREPVPLFVQEGSWFPKEWMPEIEFVKPYTKEAKEYNVGEAYYMAFVTQEIFTPIKTVNPWTQEKVLACELYPNIPCTSNLVTMRHSFLRVPEENEYQPLNYVDTLFNHFGFFRLSQPTYIRSCPDPKSKAPGPSYGETDYQNFNILRYNIFKRHFKRDKKGNLKRDENGRPIPLDLKEKANLGIRKIVYYLSPHFPRYLIRPAFQLVAEWNEIFMEMIRDLKGEELPKTPYHPFKIPEDPLDYDCYIHGPPDPEHPKSIEDFKDEVNLKFLGDECVIVLRVNSCDLVDEEGRNLGYPCEKIGDLRYKFIHYIDVPGVGFLGISTLRGDPETGQIISGDAGIAGYALGLYRTRALEWYDLISGEVTKEDILTGETVRTYFANLGMVRPPAIPRVPSLNLKKGFKQKMEYLNLLKGKDAFISMGKFFQRPNFLKNTYIERWLLQGENNWILTNTDRVFLDSLSNETLNKVSPLRMSLADLIQRQAERDIKIALRNIEEDNPYIDWSVKRFVEENKDLTRQELTFKIERLLFRYVVLHELGHSLGLRHNFAGSIDKDNFNDEYFKIIDAYPEPKWQDYDIDNNGIIDIKEAEKYQAAIAKNQKERELAGLDLWTSASIMDYMPNWYNRLVGLRRYERAAIRFAYGQQVEVYHRKNKNEIPRADKTPRIFWTYYQGGEICEKDEDCPYHKKSGRLSFEQQKITSQTCRKDPQKPNGTKICSEYYQDFKRKLLKEPDLLYLPVHYKFCSDERMLDWTLPGCNMLDEGTSFREIVRNLREAYHREYIFQNFRRYSRNFPGEYMRWLFLRIYFNLIKIFQQLFYRYSLEPGFLETQGPLGFEDHYLASVDILNLFAEIIGQPDIGRYRLNPETNSYCKVELWRSWCREGKSKNIEIGKGKYLWSDYQRGLSGFRRWERVGTIYDKIYAIQALTIRNWGIPFTIDEEYFVNFYDLFPQEITQLFGGIIKDLPSEYAPRYKQEEDGFSILYMNFWRGGCKDKIDEECIKEPLDYYNIYPSIDGTSNLLLRAYTALFSLAFIPTYFDTSFEKILYVCLKEECPRPAPEAKEDHDFVTYTSERTQRTYRAFQVWKEGKGISIVFDMLKEAKENRKTLNKLRYLRDTLEEGAEKYKVLSEIDRIQLRLETLDSFLDLLLEYQRRFDILTPFRY